MDLVAIPVINYPKIQLADTFSIYIDSPYFDTVRSCVLSLVLGIKINFPFLLQ